MTESHSGGVGPGPSMPSRTYGFVAPEISVEKRIEQLVADRDRYASMLLSAEQALAKRTLAEAEELELYEQARHELEECRQAYLLLINSRSWRLVKPVRVLARAVRRCIRVGAEG